MKKAIIMICTLCLLTVFVSSALAKKDGESSFNADSSTMLLETQTSTYSAVVPAKKSNAKPVSLGEASMASPYPNDAAKLKAATAVIAGTVELTETVLDGSDVFTKSQVRVDRCYKGTLAKGSSIYVKELGGFVSSKEYGNAISVEKFNAETQDKAKDEMLDIRLNGSKVMEKGEKVIIFLVPVKGSTINEFKQNCYEPLRVWQGKLLLNEESGKYIPYVPSEEAALVEASEYTAKSFSKFIDEEK